MPAERDASSVWADTAHAAALLAKSSWKRSIAAWLYVPLGLVAVMAICFGVNSLISLSSVSFPASVACMIILFLSLTLSQVTLGDRNTKRIINLIDVPCGFALRYINILFCPAFVTLPLSPPISGIEVAKIIAVFIVGYAAVFVFTAYFVRTLQLVLGTSKRAMTERAEELGDEDDNIPLAETQNEANGTTTPSSPGARPSLSTASSAVDAQYRNADDYLQTPLRAQNPDEITGTGGPPDGQSEPTSSEPLLAPLRHDPPPLTRAQRWAALASPNLDLITYSMLCVLVGLPVYYGAGYAMPVQITLNVVFYLAALRIPAKWRTILHPVLASSSLSIIGFWILALIHGDTLKDSLRAYSTGSTYTKLWEQTPNLPLPGAGDVFSSVLDVSIIALGLPMFQYRNELKARFLTIVIPNLSVSVGSLFAYPALCYAIGISATRSLAFPSRSLTLALATPATRNLGGDPYTVAPLCIFSGILGVVVGPWALNRLRIPEDDYITRGITLGANSSAVATALLLTTDPRAAAFSALTMGLFGTITVALSSVPPFVRIIQGLVGM